MSLVSKFEGLYGLFVCGLSVKFSVQRILTLLTLRRGEECAVAPSSRLSGVSFRLDPSVAIVARTSSI